MGGSRSDIGRGDDWENGKQSEQVVRGNGVWLFPGRVPSSGAVDGRRDTVSRGHKE